MAVVSVLHYRSSWRPKVYTKLLRKLFPQVQYNSQNVFDRRLGKALVSFALPRGVGKGLLLGESTLDCRAAPTRKTKALSWRPGVLVSRQVDIAQQTHVDKILFVIHELGTHPPHRGWRCVILLFIVGGNRCGKLNEKLQDLARVWQMS